MRLKLLSLMIALCFQKTYCQNIDPFLEGAIITANATENSNYKNIKNVPEVQVVMDMDGWGNKVLKRSTWLRYIYREPVEYAGFKLFYKHDTKTGADQLYSPEELVKFTPKPIYIQYQ